METGFLIALLVVALALFVTQVVALEVVSLGLIGVLALSGILTTSEALSGFSSSATLTVAAMLVLSAGLERAGVVDWTSAQLERWAGGGRVRLLLVLGTTTAALSAFMNNTPVVALMIPVALTLGRRSDVVPSKLLIPISYFSILGGTCTLFGTSTNILVDSLYRDAGGPGFGVFEFAKIGVLYLVVGSVYVLAVSGWLLPARVALSQMLGAAGGGTFVTELAIPVGSPFVGRTLGGLFAGPGDVRVLELIRGEEPTLAPDAASVIEAGDALLLEGNARDIHNTASRDGFQFGTVVADDERVRITRLDLRVAEAVITPNSRFVGRKVRELGLGRQLGVHVLAVRRLGREHHVHVREWRLRSGDVLLVQGEPRSLAAVNESGDALLVLGVDRTLTFPRKAPVAIAILAGVVLLATVGAAPIVVLALLGAGLMLLTRCLSTADAMRAVDPAVVLLLAGTIPLGLAMEKTGLAAQLAEQIVAFAGGYGPVVVVSVLYLVTSVLTEVLSNNAAAVLLTPIGFGLAAQLGVDPKPLLVAIAFGASASFATPIGYQTNTLVMGPGGYRFGDYLRIGVPLNLLTWIAASLLIPLMWPL